MKHLPTASRLGARQLAAPEGVGRLGDAYGTTRHHALTYQPGMLNGCRSAGAAYLARACLGGDRATGPGGRAVGVPRRWCAPATVEVAATAPVCGCVSGIPARWFGTVELSPAHNSARRRMGGGGDVRQ